jgi:hypothetical protein
MLMLKFLVVTGTSLGRLQICLARNTSKQVGKAPIGEAPVGKTPIGKAPLVTKGC